MKTEFAILGGGVAGLSAANRFADVGRAGILIDAGRFPAHKVCGEFLSPECVPLLEGWGIDPPVTIRRARYHYRDRKLAFELPVAAAGFSRFDLDHQLAERAAENGFQVLTETRITGVASREDGHEIALSDGRVIEAKTILVGTGRIFGKTPPEMNYLGYKMHFRNLDLDQTLVMFAFPGVYLGLSNVAPGVANLACMATIEAAAAFSSPEAHIAALQANPALDNLLQKAEPVFEEWMSVKTPAFGIRAVQDRPNALFIGDAAGSIYPATGNGLGMAMTGGVMAADMILDGKAATYRAAWLRRYRSRFRWGRRLHEAMLRPVYARMVMAVGGVSPRVPAFVYAKTREVM